MVAEVLTYDVELSLYRDRETPLERAICRFAERRGWVVYKWVCPGLRGVPDRIMIRAGRTIFVEVKRADKPPTKQQALRHAELRAKGAEVYSWDSMEDACAVLY